MYKSLFKPVWLYEIQLWGNAKKSNLKKIQTFQNIALRKLTNASPYVSKSYTSHKSKSKDAKRRSQASL